MSELYTGFVMFVGFFSYSMFFYIILRICSAIEEFIYTKID